MISDQGVCYFFAKKPHFFCYLLYGSSIFMLFFNFDPQQNHGIVTSSCMHYFFCQGGEVKLSDKSVLPVMKKEGKGKGKLTISPWIKNGRANSFSIFFYFILFSNLFFEHIKCLSIGAILEDREM